MPPWSSPHRGRRCSTHTGYRRDVVPFGVHGDRHRGPDASIPPVDDRLFSKAGTRHPDCKAARFRNTRDRVKARPVIGRRGRDLSRACWGRRSVPGFSRSRAAGIAVNGAVFSRRGRATSQPEDLYLLINIRLFPWHLSPAPSTGWRNILAAQPPPRFVHCPAEVVAGSYSTKC